MAKKSKTKAEKQHLTRVAELGCVICQRPANIHHLLRGKGTGQKASHYETIPLCHEHHQGGGIGVAIHAGIESWEARWNTEDHYLKLVHDALGLNT